jgi:hypothetical protein
LKVKEGEAFFLLPRRSAMDCLFALTSGVHQAFFNLK